jgi:hypothetical protein
MSTCPTGCNQPPPPMFTYTSQRKIFQNIFSNLLVHVQARDPRYTALIFVTLLSPTQDTFTGYSTVQPITVSTSKHIQTKSQIKNAHSEAVL